jgi:hypothetical protein
MKKLKSIAITNAEQVEIMRNIYNDNLDMLSTRPLPYRNFEEQQQWWKENKHILKAFLYEPIEQPGNYIAFLVLTDRGLFDTPIIAIKKEEWGSGYGQEIVLDYIYKANRPLAGSQLQSNGAICHINKKVGWQIIGQKEQPVGIVDLLYHPGVNPNIENPQEVYQAILKHHGIEK